MHDHDQDYDDGNTGGFLPSLEELEHLHRTLTPDERNELLECLLIAASKGPGEMMQALAPWLTAAAAQEMFDEFW